MEWAYCPEQAYFLTFTVAPEYETGSLDKKMFLTFIKAARQDIGHFRYYAVGEYGDDSLREHYHLAIFPEHPAQVAAICSRWKRGFTSKSPLNHARARYLANYTAKKLTKKDDRRLKAGQEPEFRSSSRNPPFGAMFVAKFVEKYQTEKGRTFLDERGDVPRTFRLDGRIYPIGDWALKKIRTDLGIPLTHKGRAKANPNYENYYPLMEAEWKPEEAEQLEKHLDAKAKQKRYRGESPKI